MGKSQIVFGKNSVIEAVKAKKSISKVFINSGINKKSLIELLKTLDDNRTPYSYVPVQKLNKLTPHNHQGIVAKLSEITFSSLEELVETYQSPGLFVLLDGITDTRNMGAIIRSAAAANCYSCCYSNQWFSANHRRNNENLSRWGVPGSDLSS